MNKESKFFNSWFVNLRMYKMPVDSLEKTDSWPAHFLDYKLVFHRPNLFNLGKYGLNPFVNLMWYISSFGRIWVLLLFDDKVIVHSLYLSRRTFRHKYMSRKDLNIGQAITCPDYRGRGIAQKVLKLVLSYFSSTTDNFWIYCEVKNFAARKIIEKNGMVFYSSAKISKFTRIIRLTHE